MDDVFRECRERVTAMMAAAYFGFSPNRGGYIACPFHAECTPSLKLYPDGRWKCFGCQRGGDSIDFAAAYLCVSKLDAVRELDAAFHLNLFLDTKKLTPDEMERLQAERAHRQEIDAGYQMFETWRKNTIQELVKCIYLGNFVERNLDLERGGEKLSELCHYALDRREWLDYVVEDLLCGPPEKQVEAWAMRKELSKCAKKILSGED